VRDVEDLAVGQVVLELLDAPLDEALLLAGGVVLGVLAQVAMRTGFCNRLDDARSILGLEPAQLQSQLLRALCSQRLARHT